MKKLLIFSVAVLMVASCGKSGYLTVTRNNNNSVLPSTTVTDPADNFNTLWISEGTSELVAPQYENEQKRGLANFFGYNTAHYTNRQDNCLYGYTDESTMYSYYYSASCFGPHDVLRNYFTANSDFIFRGPAPKDISAVSSYSIRFAADVDEATREIVSGGSAYLQVTVSAEETLTRAFTTMSTPMTVVSCGTNCKQIKASFKDDCGVAIFHARYESDSSGTLNTPYVTFKQSADSYKKAKCYYNKLLPNSVALSQDITSSLPSGLYQSASDPGNAILFPATSLNDFVEQ